MINDVESFRTRSLGRNFIILSEIEKFQEKTMKGFLKKNKYLKKSKAVDFKEFSSEHNLLEPEELEAYLKKAIL